MNKRKQTTHQNKKPQNQSVSKGIEKSEEIPVEVAEIIKGLPKEKGQTLIRALSVKSIRADLVFVFGYEVCLRPPPPVSRL